MTLSSFPKLVDLTFFDIVVHNVNVTLQSPSLKSALFSALILLVFSYTSPTNSVPEYYKIINGNEIRVIYKDVRTKRTLKFSAASSALD
jgi:hypothetical protein